MLLNTLSRSSVTSRLLVTDTGSGTATGEELSLLSSISFLLAYPRFLRIRTTGTNGVRTGGKSSCSDAPNPDGSGAPVLSDRLLTGFDHVGDQRIAVPAVLAHPVGRVGAVHERDQCDQGHHGNEQEPDQDEHQERRHGPSRDQDHKPRHLVPHRLQSLETHVARPVSIDQPDDQGSHGPEEPGDQVEEDAKVREHRHRLLLLRAHHLGPLLLGYLVSGYPVVVVLRLHRHSSLSRYDLHKQGTP